MFISYIRTILLYLILVLTIRLMGKRQIGEMEPSEFVVTMLLANLAAAPMQDSGIPLLSGVVPILTVLSLELLLALFSMKSLFIRRLFCGRPVILIQNGVICQSNLKKTRVTLDELTEHLRQQGILDLATVKYAILETDGQISVFPYAKDQPATAKDAGIHASEQFLPYTIIQDGKVLAHNLNLAGRTEAWLSRQLHNMNCCAEELYLLTVDDKGTLYCVRKETEK